MVLGDIDYGLVPGLSNEVRAKLQAERLSASIRKELSMSDTNTVSPLRQRMIEDMAARKLNLHTQRGHIYSCRRFAAWLKRSPNTATPDEVRQFQLYLVESGISICNRNRIMTGVRFLFRVTLRRHDLAAEVWHIKEPERLPPVLSPEEVKRVLTMATSLKSRAMLTLAYGCGLRAGEVVRLRARDIDSEQKIIRIIHVSLEQLKVMNAIERCRTAALGGHVARCENTACGHTEISYNSCGNRHRPKCQGSGVTPMARRPRRGALVGSVFPRRLHVAERAA
jgi:hypothetical protein